MTYEKSDPDPKEINLVPSEDWLRRVAAEEDRYPSISVGGLLCRLGMYPIADDAAQERSGPPEE